MCVEDGVELCEKLIGNWESVNPALGPKIDSIGEGGNENADELP